MTFTLNLQPTYFDLIKSGQKTVEGRIATEKFHHIQIGDSLVFINNQTEEQLTCQITGFSHYRTFQEMLVSEGLSNCLPGITSLQQGIEIYESLPGYKEKVVQYGAIAMNIRVYPKIR